MMPSKALINEQILGSVVEGWLMVSLPSHKEKIGSVRTTFKRAGNGDGFDSKSMKKPMITRWHTGSLR